MLSPPTHDELDVTDPFEIASLLLHYHSQLSLLPLSSAPPLSPSLSPKYETEFERESEGREGERKGEGKGESGAEGKGVGPFSGRPLDILFRILLYLAQNPHLPSELIPQTCKVSLLHSLSYPFTYPLI